ncbi:MAG: hypothetical protein ACRC46_02985 [Thermoguttaceae bacterium]
MNRSRSVCTAILFSLLLATCFAQPPAGMHAVNTSGMPLGEVGQTRLARAGAPSAVPYQPVRFNAPNGVQIALAAEGDFVQPQPVPLVVGMRIGRVYRFKVTGIPLAVGSEVFPTIELIDRVYPPAGRELEFPIEVTLTHDDLTLALDGKFVTKVVYVENPMTALPERVASGYDVPLNLPPGSDPLAMADTLGRPVAIVRIGGRQPSGSPSDYAAFLLGCPAWLEFARDPQGNTLFRERVAAAPTLIR